MNIRTLLGPNVAPEFTNALERTAANRRAWSASVAAAVADTDASPEAYAVAHAIDRIVNCFEDDAIVILAAIHRKFSARAGTTAECVTRALTDCIDDLHYEVQRAREHNAQEVS